MSATWIVVDVNFLAWRAFYGEARGDPAAVVPSVRHAVGQYQERFAARARTVFCFDKGPYRRADLLKVYKAKRGATDTDEQKEAKRDVRERVDRYAQKLREEGRHVLSMAGFEADDHIAAAVESVPKPDHSVIISRDKDLWQLLSHRVTMLDPVTDEIMTRDLFRARHEGLHPSEWVEVKALAGCATDDIPGIDGVADKTAVKYLTGKMNKLSPTYGKIINFVGTAAHVNNLALCRLPFPGTPPARLERKDGAVVPT